MERDGLRETPEDTPDPREKRVSEALARYVDRLNRGEAVDPEEVGRECPDIAGDVPEQLEVFIGTAGSNRRQGPLGTIGEYTLRREIGRGGMGVVY